MRESVTYQAILEEGREEGRVQELHRTILRQERVRFGEVDETVRGEMIRDIEVLEELTVRLVTVAGWAGPSCWPDGGDHGVP